MSKERKITVEIYEDEARKLLDIVWREETRQHLRKTPSRQTRDRLEWRKACRNEVDRVRTGERVGSMSDCGDFFCAGCGDCNQRRSKKMSKERKITVEIYEDEARTLLGWFYMSEETRQHLRKALRPETPSQETLKQLASHLCRNGSCISERTGWKTASKWMEYVLENGWEV